MLLPGAPPHDLPPPRHPEPLRRRLKKNSHRNQSAPAAAIHTRTAPTKPRRTLWVFILPFPPRRRRRRTTACDGAATPPPPTRGDRDGRQRRAEERLGGEREGAGVELPGGAPLLLQQRRERDAREGEGHGHGSRALCSLCSRFGLRWIGWASASRERMERIASPLPTGG